MTRLNYARLILALPLAPVRPSAGEPPANTVAAYNYILGVQTINPSYQFTPQARLVETAEAIQAMGATVIKFELSRSYPRELVAKAQSNPKIRSLTELARDEPSFHRVLDMPFARYVLWTHSFACGASFRNGFPQPQQEKEYREIYEFTRYLLTTYSGSGKTFFLGHWEGDGLLRGSVKREDDAHATPQAIQGMIDWLNCRQRAIDAAKRDTPHKAVEVWHYTEVNHVQVAIEGRKAVTNMVLPHVPVDFVSYSSYDTQEDPQRLKAALDFIESKLTPKPRIASRRVFIGEYGFPAVRFSPAKQDEMSRRVIVAALQWGCPLALYWEFYNNEVDPQGRQRGFWMIDNHGVKQPIYETHRRYYQKARAFVAEEIRRTGRPPDEEQFQKKRWSSYSLQRDIEDSAKYTFSRRFALPTPLSRQKAAGRGGMARTARGGDRAPCRNSGRKRPPDPTALRRRPAEAERQFRAGDLPVSKDR